MLILTRKVGESIIIGEDITLTVLGVTRNRQIKLGIDAPGNVSVHREEIFLKIKEQGGTLVESTESIVEPAEELATG